MRHCIARLVCNQGAAVRFYMCTIAIFLWAVGMWLFDSGAELIVRS